MKKLLLSFCAILFLNSCVGDLSACDCAQIFIETVFSEDEKFLEPKEMEKKLEENLAPCEEFLKDIQFRKAYEKCITEKITL